MKLDILPEELIKSIRNFQKDGIKNKALTKDQLALIYSENWFNLWVPKELNGLEFDLPSGLKLLKELAYVDAGLGWTITLCAGANMFAGFIDPQIAEAVWINPQVCFGGSGQVSGKAQMNNDHYLVSGFWQYATGAPHLSHFTFNALLWKGDQPLLQENGEQQFKSFFVDKKDVLVHYDWDTFGLECTASHSFSLQEVKVPLNQVFNLEPENKTNDSSLYSIPFLPFAELTLVVNYLGMFHRFVDLLEKLYFEKTSKPEWVRKHSKIRFRELDEFQQQLFSFDEEIKSFSEILWNQVSSNHFIADSLLSDISSRCRETVKWGRLQMAELMPYAGIKGAQREEEINIVFRNINTASQHGLLNN